MDFLRTKVSRRSYAAKNNCLVPVISHERIKRPRSSPDVYSRIGFGHDGGSSLGICMSISASSFSDLINGDFGLDCPPLSTSAMKLLLSKIDFQIQVLFNNPLRYLHRSKILGHEIWKTSALKAMKKLDVFRGRLPGSQNDFNRQLGGNFNHQSSSSKQPALTIHRARQSATVQAIRVCPVRLRGGWEILLVY